MELRTDRISYKDTGAFNELVTDYLEQAPGLEGLYVHAPAIGSFDRMIREKQFPESQRKLLADTLASQYQGVNAETPVRDNIAALRRPETFTVTTGHQLSIFGGPLYFVYKIVSAIKLAQQLSDRYPDRQFVPVFWMASEDHDIAEISSIHLFGKELHWNTSYAGAAGRAGTGEFSEMLAGLKSIMGDSSPHADALASVFETAYNGNHNLSQATRSWVNDMFGKYGLVIIEPDDQSFKQVLVPYMRKELQDGLSHAAVQAANENLEGRYKTQVHPRGINLFYLDHNLRERIERREDGSFSVINTSISFTGQEMDKLLEEHPEQLSPNVVLRPLYQEVLLPNLAYIGGGAEVSYWLQYGQMFSTFGVDMPVILLRNSALWVDSNTHAKAAKLSIGVDAYFEETESLIRRFIERLPDASVSLQEERTALTRLYETIKSKAVDIDPTLQASVEADLSRALKQIQSIEDKLVRAEKRKHETELSQIRAIKEKLFPGGALQERHDNFIPLFLKYGTQFFDALLLDFDPLGKDFLIFSEV